MFSPSMTPTSNAIFMTSPPPPFPTSSAAFTSVLFSSSGAGRPELQSLFIRSGLSQSHLLNHNTRIQSPLSKRNCSVFSPVPPLDGEQSLPWSTYGNCIQSSMSRVLPDMSDFDARSPASMSCVFPDMGELATRPPFQAASGVGLGLGLGIPVQREYVLSARPGSPSPGRTPPQSPVPLSPAPAATWSMFEAFSAFFDGVYGASTESPMLSSSTPPLGSLTGILPHIFAPTMLSPIIFWRPNPPTPEPTCPASLRFNGVPVYNIQSPVLSTETNKRALRRPAPRRPRSCTASVEVKSPVFEYHASSGTTPFARHGWDPAESFNASRGNRRPFRRPSEDSIPARDNSPIRTPPPALPWTRVPVAQTPFIPLPPSPVLRSNIARTPERENNFHLINRFAIDARRRALLRPVFVEPRWSMALQIQDRKRAPEERKAIRAYRLGKEEKIAKKERRARRWWVRAAKTDEDA
ncbi:hypothetical protein B0H15DRAFT_816330 [Mycena belliarum]|uniref:Uncharacterized protein n=1 Tax=Mycena belliarum TaxID=1033014 RepID=A0AAD6UFG3_9AGAR|nr:hypothetical protein B0H15DRAFT_816330 [Mycena belliae]